MFNALSDSFSNIFQKLKGKAFLDESDVNDALRSVRVALLEADVALPVVKDFIDQVKPKAIGEEVIKSVSPANLVVKIVQDNLIEFLGKDVSELNLNTKPPAIIMMVGLQGSGKTTSAAKLANRLKTKQGKKVLLASLDIYRPAAQEQLKILASQIGVDFLPIQEPNIPLSITKRALDKATIESYDVLILDTAGRLHIDKELMEELQQVKKLSQPIETLLVGDALTGQDAVNIAKEFNTQVGITGIILTRIDGDSRGGAALSMKHVSNCPIKFVGVGEKISEFEQFYPERIASRILGMGDVVSLVEKAIEAVAEEDTKAMEKKLRQGRFDMNDLAKQLSTLRKLGGVGGFMAMLPGMGKLKEMVNESDVDDKRIKRVEAIISSMTKQERAYPNILNGSRKRRIAAGAGVEVQDVNMVIKQHKQMEGMIKKISKMDKKSIMRSGIGGMLGKIPKRPNG